MIRNVAIDMEAATRRISIFFRHRIPRYSNRPRGLKIAITTSTTPSGRDSVVAKTLLMIGRMKAIKPMTFTKSQMIFD
jgi:hypothetical protein